VIFPEGEYSSGAADRSQSSSLAGATVPNHFSFSLPCRKRSLPPLSFPLHLQSLVECPVTDGGIGEGEEGPTAEPLGIPTDGGGVCILSRSLRRESELTLFRSPACHPFPIDQDVPTKITVKQRATLSNIIRVDINTIPQAPEHLVRDQGVGGSNPLAPTILPKEPF
jgi:hypothetical protein